MLRFTHDGLDSRAAYAHGQHGKKSVYESLHDLWSKRSHPEDFLFDIAIKDVLIYTISNRRLASLRAYHSWSWDKLLFVRCKVVNFCVVDCNQAVECGAKAKQQSDYVQHHPF